MSYPGSQWRANNYQAGYGAPPPQSQPSYPSYHQQQPPYNGGGGGYGYQQQPQQSGGWGGPPPQSMNQGGYPQYQSGSVGMPPGPGYGNFGPPPGPPPMHYGQQNAPGHAPPAYAHMPIHYQPSAPPQQSGGQRPYYQYSNCTGKRKALIIGINYTGQRGELKGCHNDAKNIQRFLVNNFRFKPEDMVVLLDERGKDYRSVPTRENILRGCQWLVAGAAPNDSLFIHYSGHGGKVEDTNGDEDDGYDETIYPVDHERTGQIVDDQLHDMLVKPLPAGCRLTAVFDSCHSGSVLDLPYIYSTEGKIKEPNLLADVGQGALGAVGNYMRGDLGGVASSLFGAAKKAMKGDKVDKWNKQNKCSPADVVMWSGCKDSQTSADTSVAGQATGAMSWALVTSLSQYPQQSYKQLLNSVRDLLASKYSQKPQLSSSHEMDTDLMFII